jgi:hypothetical protein
LRGWSFLRFASIVLAVSFLGACAPRQPPNDVNHVCARPWIIPKRLTTWALSGSGTLVWEAWMVEVVRERIGPSHVWVLDANAPEDSVQSLPIPYNEMKCPKRLPPRVAPPKKPVEARKAEEKKRAAAPKEVDKPVAVEEAPPKSTPKPPRQEEAHRTQARTVVRQVGRSEEAPADLRADAPRWRGTVVTTVTRVARRDPACSAEPGQVRRRAGSGAPCSGGAKVTLAPSRPVVMEAEEPAPIPPPRPVDGPLADWKVNEPDVKGLSPERAAECVANLCHARHPNFVPNGKDGSGKKGGPGDGALERRGAKPEKAGGGRQGQIVRGPGGARKHPLGARTEGGPKSGGGKNSKHANEDKREAARDRYEELKRDYERLLRKPNKTPDDKAQLENLKGKLEHAKRQANWSGEHHSQRAKGQR